jgi:hypothetical protein
MAENGWTEGSMAAMTLVLHLAAESICYTLYHIVVFVSMTWCLMWDFNWPMMQIAQNNMR